MRQARGAEQIMRKAPSERSRLSRRQAARTMPVAERTALRQYASGAMSRAEVMRCFGLDWYGVLVDRLRDAGIEVERPAHTSAMTELAVRLLRRHVKWRYRLGRPALRAPRCGSRARTCRKFGDVEL